MDSIFLLVPIVIFFVACAVKLFFWAVNSGQYDDLETEGRRILFDDDEPREQRPAAKGQGDPESSGQDSGERSGDDSSGEGERR
ncbi:cbb3-type cytochrome oxidase assembly protein CcoS [Microbulbifer elongatus]|uniref:cbb3-type cytochrome oxidase assembly protein CcoS n=1 Tax=Microbulbifer elongatus TaxID=86173 RepID=UPI001CFEF1E5|nr:cbb3-type cytochrome oxidase assembly protein CcoS [Microbulbifer elongatus]